MNPNPALPAPLLAWFEENARILPWRSDPTAYRVWVSEIMLQQTRVEAVKPYYDAFMTALPTVKDLAEAPQEQVLKLWEGLGYYSRARNLQKAAQIIMTQYHGEIPGDFDVLKQLPGIGDYTAGAIASIAFDVPVAAVDGNVLRVMARLYDHHEPVDIPRTKQLFTHTLEAIYPREKPGQMTQAWMELGATVCVPGKQPPKCHICPLAHLCLARERNTWSLLPVKSPKKARRLEDRTVFLLFSKGKYAIQKRPEPGLLAGLWEFPSITGHAHMEDILLFLTARSLSPLSIRPLPDAIHIFTHVEWNMKGYMIEVSDQSPPFHWVSTKEILESFAIPSAYKVYVNCMKVENKS
ncbi:MAG TPA: A/G-specific adenine glycosylase [Clostridiales bacterium]|nr:A/G-specific adenine glycosylase [Clostridiales bacterium]